MTMLRMNQLSQDEECIEDKIPVYSGQETTDKSMSCPGTIAGPQGRPVTYPIYG